jgi:hypothetical protein
MPVTHETVPAKNNGVTLRTGISHTDTVLILVYDEAGNVDRKARAHQRFQGVLGALFPSRAGCLLMVTSGKFCR